MAKEISGIKFKVYIGDTEFIVVANSFSEAHKEAQELAHETATWINSFGVSHIVIKPIGATI